MSGALPFLHRVQLCASGGANTTDGFPEGPIECSDTADRPGRHAAMEILHGAFPVIPIICHRTASYEHT